ncbi:protease inhibitor Inh/omp19 family protein [Xenorhabdus griffiniae]|uniref:Protease inhibitor Inh/omp19 family protein n=1 Tax=Xenorhabdus griffiniae TaxID=351672 RepID=A0ABY9XGG2_9GAMM|nr:protease inhibitor Inh/omp19 family protein [Xenorhabdus griffiniae]MBD1228831.1 protease inhibitor Inh/omp19 family protein [Xenorhabdus griffiniae]MBE8587368.1 protease inhibitor Inh/omp19 family protein [Xenorhabdus griffiniae]WMV71978.1 protease inhibitor Inh/omp19 family protein [Xenorhabdus griffiniae]WNH01655.1 protease inhibitor Inh/omp19 family protein [Xenorhabdus griffiniae]
MASSLRLPTAGELKGLWQLSDGNKLCSIELTDTRLPEGSLWALKGNACVTELIGQPVAGWYPSPDGITLTDNDGNSLAFFSPESEQWIAYFVDGRELVMTFSGAYK